MRRVVAYVVHVVAMFLHTLMCYLSAVGLKRLARSGYGRLAMPKSFWEALLTG